MHNPEDNPRLKALEELTSLDEELGLYDDSLPEDLEIDGHKLVRTSWACPEQYDVFVSEDKVGYLRLRHGKFRADVPDCGGETVYASKPKGDGIFCDEERMKELSKAIAAIKSRKESQ
jgi:hypothetical protein